MLLFLMQSEFQADVGFLTITDDKILLDLGARPECLSPQDQVKYTNDLRNVIQDIRNRKIRDLNVVASEIATYRTRFIEANAKLLPS